MERSYDVSGENKNKYHEIVANPVLGPDFARMGAANPDIRVLCINFDGTWNDKDKINGDDRKTVVATTHEAMFQKRSDQLESFYYKGVGTYTGVGKGLVNALEGATGMGCVRNAKQAHADMVEQVARWREENPNVQVHIHVTGFSRGSATALHFMNLVDEFGALPKGADPRKNPTIAPGKVKTSAVILDCVSTGQAGLLKMNVPDTNVSLLHIVADGEQRKTFKVRKIGDEPNAEISFGSNAYLEGSKKILNGSSFLYKRINEVVFPSARHSDVGGSYGDGNIREISEYIVNRFMQSLGLPAEPKKPTFEHIQQVKFHDSRFKFQKFFNKKDENELQKVANRKEKNAEIDRDGYNVVVMDCNFKGLNGGKPKNEIAVTPLASLDSSIEPSTKYLGKEHKATLIFENNAYRLTENGRNSPFQLANDQLMFADLNVPGFGSLDELNRNAIQLKIQGIKPEPIEISVDYRRNGVSHDAKQVKGIEPPEKFIEPTDPWPVEMRDSLKTLNTMSEADPKLASTMYGIAVEAAAMQIVNKNDDVNTVKVGHSVLVNRTSEGLTRKNEVQINCERNGLPDFGTQSAATNENERNLHTTLRNMARGLGMIADKFRLLGVKPDTKVEHMYTADGEGEKYSARYFVPIDQDIKGEMRVSLPVVGIFNSLARGGLQSVPSKKKGMDI